MLKNLFKNTKSKWQPIFIYKPICSYSVRMVFARYDFSTGLYDFKTKTVARDVYTNHVDNLLINIDFEKTLQELKEK